MKSTLLLTFLFFLSFNSNAQISGPYSVAVSQSISLIVPATTGYSGGIWSSSDVGVAIVGQNGRVTGMSVGAATITFTPPGTLVMPLTRYITVHSIFLSPTTNLCDAAPYKLVFFDGFNGYVDNTGHHHPNDLDPNKFQANSDYCNGSTQFMDPSNTSVSGGECLLKMSHGSFSATVPSWCSGSPATSHYKAGGIIATAANHFSYGKFEARISYPTFQYAHSDFELESNPGSTPVSTGNCIDNDHYAIDIAEAYGTKDRVIDIFGLHILIPQPSYVDYSTHKWQCNYPVGIVSTTNNYPGAMKHMVGAYHVYTCEWEPNFIHWYIDGNFAATRARYVPYPFGLSNFSCTPPTGQYTVAQDFPIDGPIPDNLMTMMLEIARDNYAMDNSNNPYDLGTMKIDWVKVWQKHPDKNHPDLCDRTMSGPKNICDMSAHTYTITGTGAISTGGDWFWTVGPYLTVLSRTINTITVRPTIDNGSTWVKFNDDNPSCPTVYQPIAIGVGSAGVSHTVHATGGHYIHNFSVSGGDPATTTYTWSFQCPGNPPIILYGVNVTYTAPCDGSLLWTVSLRNDCGSADISNHILYRGMASYNTTSTNDSEVSEIIYHSVNNNDLAIGNKIANNNTIIYPNPTSKELHILLDKNYYAASSNMSINITDITGKVLITVPALTATDIESVNVEGLAPGLYLVEIKSSIDKQTYKFIKQ